MLRKVLYAVLLATVLLLIFATPACTIVKETGGGHKVVVTEKQHKLISDAGDGATGTLGLLSMFFPALAPIATAAGVGTLTWKKMKKDVTKYKSPMEMYVKALEHIKTNDAETWAKVKAEIEELNPTLPVRTTVAELKEVLKEQTVLATT